MSDFTKHFKNVAGEELSVQLHWWGLEVRSEWANKAFPAEKRHYYRITWRRLLGF